MFLLSWTQSSLLFVEFPHFSAYIVVHGNFMDYTFTSHIIIEEARRTFIKAKLKKADGQTNIEKYYRDALLIAHQLIFLTFIISKLW